MKTSESIKTLAPALLKAQKTIEYVIKSSENPFYHSTYADLTAVIGAVKEPLNAQGIIFLQGLTLDGDKPCIETMLLHECGEYISTVTPVYCAKQNDPQAFGSGITYSKRYALQALLGLPTADDDGESATDHAGEKPKANGKARRAPAKPPIDMVKLNTKEGVDFIKSFPSAETALATLAKTKTISVEAEAFIKELFDTYEG